MEICIPVWLLWKSLTRSWIPNVTSRGLFVYNKLISFCWYWWNWWPSLLKHSLKLVFVYCFFALLLIIPMLTSIIQSCLSQISWSLVIAWPTSKRFHPRVQLNIIGVFCLLHFRYMLRADTLDCIEFLF